MIKNQIIEDLRKQKSNYTSPESAIDQSNSLDALSTDIYTDSERFIYELLQNADDASNKYGKLELTIRIQNDFLIISHQGEKFSEIDIESICSVGDGNKKGDENKTGFKGIGFKSAFSHSDYVVINSNGYCFRFDKNYWENQWENQWGSKSDWKASRLRKGKDDKIKMPWQIIPIWTDINEFDSVENYNVSTIIRHKDISNLEVKLTELFSNTQILLFLRSEEVTVSLIGKEKLTIQKIKNEETVKLIRNGVTLSEWMLKTYKFEVDTSVRNLIENDVRIPKKLRLAKKTEISFAVPIKNGDIQTDNSGLIFTYLPTSVSFTNFPFLINASFLTDAGRQHLHEDLKWNIWLFKQIPIMLFDWLTILAESKYKLQIFKLIPKKFTTSSELYNSFNRGLNEAIAKTEFIPNKNNQLLKAKNSVYDKTDISNFIDSEIIIRVINENYNTNYTTNSLIPNYDSQSTLKRIGVRFFENENLKELFTSKIFQSQHLVNENFNLIYFLFQQYGKINSREERESFVYELQKTPFIFDTNNKLNTPSNIYFPTVEFTDNFSSDIVVIHPSVMQKVDDNLSIKNWLNKLGIKEPTDLSFIEKTILGNESYINKINAIKVGRHLFDANKKGLLKDEHFEKISQLSILTKQGNLIKAQDTFLSNFYNPKLLLESVYDKDFYISEEYYRDKDLISEWQSFFIKAEVKHEISWTKYYIEKTEINERRDSAFFQPVLDERDGKRKYSNYGEYSYRIVGFHIHHFSFIDYTNNYSFAKIFWQNVFQLQPQKNQDVIKAASGWLSKTDSLPQNYFIWSLKNLSIFPTTIKDCRKAEEIFLSTQEIRELAGHHLPIFDYNKEISETWLNLIPFKKTLSVDDCLDVLSSIWQTNNEGKVSSDDINRIHLVYKKLASSALDFDKEKLINWSKTNKLLSNDRKTFFYPNELKVVKVDGFKASNLVMFNGRDEKILTLLKTFGVDIIDKVHADIDTSVIIEDLKIQLNHILPLIALVSVEKSRDKNDWVREFLRLSNQLSTIKFFQATKISLSYGNLDDKLKRSSYSKGNKFYYVGNWYKPRVLDSLVEPLGKFLKIKYAERHLSVLLSDTFAEGILYLKEKFGEETLSIIPEEYLLSKTQTSFVNSGSSHSPNREYNSSDESIGKKGELFLYKELKKIYSNKYINSSIEETPFGFQIGTFLKVFWRNKFRESMLDHDFKIEDNGSEIYIDSKATPHGEEVENIAFYISPNEFKLMNSVTKYLIGRVYNVASENPEIKFISMELYKLK